VPTTDATTPEPTPNARGGPPPPPNLGGGDASTRSAFMAWVVRHRWASHRRAAPRGRRRPRACALGAAAARPEGGARGRTLPLSWAGTIRPCVDRTHGPISPLSCQGVSAALPLAYHPSDMPPASRARRSTTSGHTSTVNVHAHCAVRPLYVSSHPTYVPHPPVSLRISPAPARIFAGSVASVNTCNRLERAHWVTLAQVEPAAVDQGHVGCHTCGVHEGSVLHAIGMGLLTR
jgi:hypothetical protein